MRDMPILLRLYLALGYVAAPVLHFLVTWRIWRGKESRQRRAERYGKATIERPDGALVWVHAASVGETNAILPLIERMRRDGFAVLLTTTTITSAEIAASRLPEGAVHQFVPFDVLPALRRFLGHWRPSLAVFVESEIWPATLHELASRGVPRVIVNGRLSRRSWARWRWARKIAKPVFGAIDLALTQTKMDAGRFRDLGVANGWATGNLKFDGAPLPVSIETLRGLAAATADRPIWLAASTHRGEEALIGEVHARLSAEFPDLLTVLAPRHPDRAGEIMETLGRAGMSAVQRSGGAPITASTQIYLADTIGELGLFYRLAPIAFIGGSLVPFGGHNPIEPAQLDTAIIVGPHVQSFSDVYRAFERAEAVTFVRDAETLGDAVLRFLGDPDLVATQARHARAIVDRGQGALDRTYEALRTAMPEVLTGGAPR